MSSTATLPTAPAAQDTSVLDALTKLTKQNEALLGAVTTLATGPANARTDGPLATGPFIRTGENPLTSRGYSFQRVVGFAGKQLEADKCKVELDIHERLRKLYCDRGYEKAIPNSILMPFASELLCLDMGEESFASEIHQMLRAGVSGYNPQEVASLRVKHWGLQKALSWQDDSQGGALVGPPAFGELIDLLRNNEVFMQAGAKMIPLPAQGRITFPRQTGAATAYWVGESDSFTASNETTGDVTLQAKKLGVLVKIPNELFRFASVSVEQFIREDVARVMSLKLDKTLLEAAGSALSPKGIINYTGINSHTASTVGANGNTFEPEDVANFIAKVEQQNAVFRSWIMRPLMWAGIVNRRGDAVAAGDKKGPFMFNVWRELQANFNLERQMPGNLYGYPVFKSTQVSNTRSKGSATNLTYILGGDFTDYMIALSGVLELQTSVQGDTPFTYDQTWLRGIMFADAAPRHEASFCLTDTVVEA